MPWSFRNVRSERGKQVRRIDRERRTVAQMVDIFCRVNHAPPMGLCPECQELLDYAIGRLDKCPFGVGKPTCAKCSVHCYRPDFRRRIREVMRFAGPRMLLRHPVSAIGHLVDKVRPNRARR